MPDNPISLDPGQARKAHWQIESVMPTLYSDDRVLHYHRTLQHSLALDL